MVAALASAALRLSLLAQVDCPQVVCGYGSPPDHVSFPPSQKSFASIGTGQCARMVLPQAQGNLYPPLPSRDLAGTKPFGHFAEHSAQCWFTLRVAKG
jgi:hypothetical protein